jgi:translocation and assembly module TamB
MRRALKILAWVVGIVIAIPVVAVIGLLALANMRFGQDLITSQVGKLTGGMVEADGLSGRFPDRLRIRHVAVRDKDGAWVVVENLALDWSPLALVSKVARIETLTAEGVHVFRLPESEPAANTKPAQNDNGSFNLPVRIVLDHLHVNRLEVDAPVATTEAAVSVDGSASLPTLQQGSINLALQRVDGEGRYTVAGSFDPTHIKADLDAEEPAGGLVAGLAKLPALGALSIKASIDGPRNAEATTLAVSAGPLRANATGKVDLVDQAADLDLTASAPAMSPRPDASWQSVAIDAHVHGPFTRPDASAHVVIQGLKAAGAAIDNLTAEAAGNQGHVNLKASVAGLVIPGPKPDLLQSAPLVLTADAKLDDPDRPIAFTLAHPLIAANGTAHTGGALSVTTDLRLPDLAPFAAMGGIELHGSTALTVRTSEQGSGEQASVDGTIGLTSGMAPIVALVGPNAKIGATVALNGQNITISRFDFAGAKLSANAHGTDNNGALALDYAVHLADMAAVTPTVNGTVDATGHVQGQQTNLAVQTDLRGDLGAQGVPRGPVTASIRMTGLPGAPAGDVTAQGQFAGAPLQLAVHVARATDGSMSADISRADWRSLHADGHFALAAGAKLPTGKATLRMTRLDDLRPVIGQAVTGSVTADIALDQDATLKLEAQNAGIPGTRIGRATINARVTNPTAAPAVTAQANIDGIEASGIGGNARIEVNGPQDALAIRLAAGLTGLAGSNADIASTAVVNATGKQVALNTLTVNWHDEPVRLLAPVHVSFADGLALDRLRLAIATATLEVAGRVSPRLDLTATARNLTADLAKPFAPSLAADGSASIDARLSGTTAAPTGTVRVTASGIRMRSGPARAMPPASLLATLNLAGKTTGVDARVTAGSTHLAVTGTAPLSTEGALNLHATGGVDLAITDPILTPAGRRARGTLTLDATATGAPTAPRVNGTARLANGEFQDYAQGAHLTDIAATVIAEGDTIRIASLTAHAGPGTITGSGSVGIAAPMPVNLTLTARNARPLVSDLLTADLDADLTVHGAVQTRVDAGGTVRIRRAEINVPDRLPTSVAVLNVRNLGAPPPPPAAPGPTIGLDLTVSAAQAIFIRGHGLDAEMAGRLHVGGTSAAPEISGGFHMRNGTFSLAGTTLTFSKGEISFDGSGLRNKIDPTLDFEVTNTSGNVTATLAVTGYADAPKFSLSSIPDQPQDEILAHLLFGQSAQSLGPFQYAEIAEALASLTGVGGGVAGNPLNSVRKGLGLDRLSVGSDTNGNPSLQAGRYVARGVYLGAQQGTGGDTQGTLQIDLYKGLKLQTNVGSSGSGGSSVGLTYQFEYR